MIGKIRKLRLIRESLIPVMILTVSLMLIIAYSAFMPDMQAQKITVIEIESGAYDNNGEQPGEQEEGIISDQAIEFSNDPLFGGISKLIEEGRLDEAEQRYKTVLDRSPSSHAHNDLGVLYYRKGATENALKEFSAAVNFRPPYTKAFFNRAVVHSRMENYVDAVQDYLTFAEQFPNHFETQYNLGVAYIKLGDYQQAAESLERAAELGGGPRKAKALYNLGIVYRRTDPENIEKVSKAMEAAIRLVPDYVEARFILASLEPDTKEGRARALEQYETIISLKPGYAKAHYNMGLLYWAQRKQKAAEASYRAAIKYNPEYVKARYNLGLLFLDQDRWDEAIAQFQWIVQMHPDNAETYFNLGRAYNAQKEHERSLNAYDKAIQARQGNYPEAYLNSGIVYKNMDDYDEALDRYRKAIKLKEEYPEAWYNMGLAFMHQEKHDDAVRAFRQAIQLAPQYSQAWFNLGVLYSRTEQEDNAIAAYREALEIRPHYKAASLNLAVRYSKRGQYAEAIELYEDVLKRDDTYANAWLNMGIAYLAMGKPLMAQEPLLKALSLEPDNAKTMRILAGSYMDSGKYPLAVSVLEHAVDTEPSNYQNRLLLGQALVKTGSPGEAKVALEKALLLSPDNPEIQNALEGLDKTNQ